LPLISKWKIISSGRTAYFPLMWHGQHRNRNNLGGIYRQQSNLMSLLLFFQNEEHRLIIKICQYDSDQSPEDSRRCYVI
jgi:hypothetical protein